MAARRRAHELTSEIPSLINLNIATASALLEAKKTTAVALVQAHLARIAEVNGYFHAVLETNPAAIAIVKALDEEQAKSGRRSPLHGISILLKDNLVTLDSMEATAGSTVFEGAKPDLESGVVRKQRAAGAVILGKTNLSEFSGFRTSTGISGWSPRGGLTTGAFCENMKTSGSSSGSSVATALGLAVVSIGTEVSLLSEHTMQYRIIVSPAGREAVVGFKPTVGLVPIEGTIPVIITQDSAGPIAKTVRDVGYVLNAIVESDASRPDFLLSCVSTDLSGLRIGVPRASFPTSDAVVIKEFNAALRILAGAGATIVEEANFDGIDEFNKMSADDKLYAMAGSFKRDIGLYVSTLIKNPRNISSLHDIMDLVKTDVAESYPIRDMRDWELAASVDLNGKRYKNSLEQNKYLSGRGGILGTMEKYELDMIAAPSMFGPAVSFAARGGLPLVVLPLGIYLEGTEVKMYNNRPFTTVDIGPNIPFGITFIGKAFSEATILKVAYAFEQLTKVREQTQPYKPPKTELEGFNNGSAGASKV